MCNQDASYAPPRRTYKPIATGSLVGYLLVAVLDLQLHRLLLLLVGTGFPRASKSVDKHARRLSLGVCISLFFPSFFFSLSLFEPSARDSGGIEREIGQIVILPSRLENPQEVRALTPRGSPLCPANNGGANGRRSSELKREPADARSSRPGEDCWCTKDISSLSPSRDFPSPRKTSGRCDVTRRRYK